MRRLIARALPVLACLALALLTLQLGNWQLRRADEKSALQARLDALAQQAPRSVGAQARPEEGQPLVLVGRWRGSGTVFLDNRTHEGRAGYQVFTPLELADGSGQVLVNRGWIAAGLDRARLPEVPVPVGTQDVEGRAHYSPPAGFALGGEGADGPRWQRVDAERYTARTGMPVAAWLLWQTSAADDGLLRDWPRPDAGVDRHRGYALQWYGLAALATVFGGISGWRARRGAERRVRHGNEKAGNGKCDPV